jgi:DNA-binding LacI/PurR family transcriptional regulator
MQAAADELGYNLLVYSTNDNFEKEQSIIHSLANLMVDGIIIKSMALIDQQQDYFQQLSRLMKGKKKIPVASLEWDLTMYGIDSVIVDNLTGAALATQKLIDCGARKIAFLTSNPIGIMRKRIDGYKKTLLANGIPADDALIYLGDEVAAIGGYKSILTLQNSKVEFDAVFAGNDQIAIGAMTALLEQGIRIPHDIMVMGFDNIFISSIVSPALTTVNVPKYDMGYKVCEMLINRIENTDGNHQGTAIELPIKLIERGSTNSIKITKWELENW